MRDGHPDEQARPACVIRGYDAPRLGLTGRGPCITVLIAPAICVHTIALRFYPECRDQVPRPELSGLPRLGCFREGGPDTGSRSKS